MSINRLTISGNLGRDAELRSTASGTQVLSFSVCVTDRRKNAQGQWEDKPNWIDCVMYGNRAESVSGYLSKGSHVTVAGRLSQRTYQAKDGTKRSKIEVVCEDIDFSGGSRERKAQQADEQAAEDSYSDIPF